MSYFRLRPGLAARVLFFSAVAFLASGAALAQVPVTNYVVINPIDVCDSSGKNCAPFGATCKASTGCTAVNNPSTATTSTTSTATQPTPIGFIDGDTGINITRAIWLQSGIDVTFLKLQQYNSPANIDPWSSSISYSLTDYRTLHTGNVTCKDGVSKLTSPDFQALTQHTICAEDGGPPAGAPNPPFPVGIQPSPSPPLASTLGTGMSNAIDMFFVNSIMTSPASTVYGFSWINGNGIAIAKNAFSPAFPLTPRFDTLAHEIGHSLGLDHATFGAGAANNVLTAGSGATPIRTVPSSSGCSTNGGALFDLDQLAITGCPAPPPMNPIADQLILGKSTSSTQQGQALLSGFMVPIPQGVTATAVGDVQITVNYPPFNKSGGRSAEQYVVALVIGLPSGDNFGTPAFANPNPPGFLFSFGTVNGNNGNGNLNCVKPFSGGPSIKCGVVLFQPNQFTSGTSFSFTANLVSGGGVLQQIPAGTTMTFVFSDGYATTSAFEHRDRTGTNLSAASQLPDSAVPSAIVDLTDCNTFPNVCSLGLVFTGVVNPTTGQPTPCTLTSTSTTCPSGNLPQGAD